MYARPDPIHPANDLCGQLYGHPIVLDCVFNPTFCRRYLNDELLSVTDHQTKNRFACTLHTYPGSPTMPTIHDILTPRAILYSLNLSILSPEMLLRLYNVVFMLIPNFMQNHFVNIKVQ